MDEYLDGHAGGLAYAADFVDGELAGKDKAREAGAGEEGGLFGRPDVALGRGVEGKGQLHGQIGHILDDEGVDAGVP